LSEGGGLVAGNGDQALHLPGWDRLVSSVHEVPIGMNRIQVVVHLNVAMVMARSRSLAPGLQARGLRNLVRRRDDDEQGAALLLAPIGTPPIE
jgi:hypothetical protein